MEVADIAITFGTMLTVISTLPSIFSDHKPSKWTSIMAFIAIVIFSSTYFAVGYYGAAIMNSMAALLWFVLIIQEVRIENRK